MINRINNASKEELTLILYEACEQNIIQGISFIKQKNFEQANIFLQKAEKIITEFRLTLDHNYEIAKQLESLYLYAYNCLVQGNINNNLSLLDEALYIISTLKNTWKQALETLSKSL